MENEVDLFENRKIQFLYSLTFYEECIKISLFLGLMEIERNMYYAQNYNNEITSRYSQAVYLSSTAQ